LQAVDQAAQPRLVRRGGVTAQPAPDVPDELSAGPHEVRPNAEQSAYDEIEERARRLDVLQRAESEFDPIPFDAQAARAYGRVAAAVIAAGRKPRRRFADLMIAATAIVEELALFTTNPDDYLGMERLLTVVPVTRPGI
jgi:predicted nucleic acid-binding protein